MTTKTILRLCWVIAACFVLLICLFLLSIDSAWAQLLGATLLLAFVCVAVAYHLPEGDPLLGAPDPLYMHNTHLPHFYRNGTSVCEHCGALSGTRRAKEYCPHSLIP